MLWLNYPPTLITFYYNLKAYRLASETQIPNPSPAVQLLSAFISSQIVTMFANMLFSKACVSFFTLLNESRRRFNQKSVTGVN